MPTAPSFSAVGIGSQSTTLNISVAWPAHVAGQLGILLIVSDSSGIPVTVSPTSGWTAVSDTNQTVGVGSSGCRMQVYRKIASSSAEANATVPLSTNTSVYGKIFTFDGCTTTSSPVPVSVGSVQSTPSGTVTYPATATTIDNSLIVCICANSGNNGSMTGTMVNASLTSIQKHQTTNTSNVTSAILSGVKTTFGSVSSGSSVWTTAPITAHVSATLVLVPVPDPVSPADTTALDFRPDQEGYSCNIQNSCVEVGVSGGPLRKRQCISYAPHIVSATWVLHSNEYSAFMGFFRTELNGGESDFLLDLITDIGTPTTHNCRTLGGLPRLTKQMGEAYYVSCVLEAQQNPTFTGLIKYQEGNFVTFAADDPGPFMEDSFEPGDIIRIVDSYGTHPSGTIISLDGVYEVASNVGTHAITLTSPATVNSDWTVLATLGAPGTYGDASNGNVISTITKVPT